MYTQKGCIKGPSFTFLSPKKGKNFSLRNEMHQGLTFTSSKLLLKPTPWIIKKILFFVEDFLKFCSLIETVRLLIMLFPKVTPLIASIFCLRPVLAADLGEEELPRTRKRRTRKTTRKWPT